MKICILTQPLRSNYGGLLQAYALQKVVRDLGHDVVTDRYGSTMPQSWWWRFTHFGYHLIKRYLLNDKRYNPFDFMFGSLGRKMLSNENTIAVNTERFIDLNIKTIDLFGGHRKPRKRIVSDFDTFIVGSDQVWRPRYNYLPVYFLTFTPTRKIAYSVSWGESNLNEFSLQQIQSCAAAAQFFNAISVREDAGVALCREYFGVEVTHLLDPTLLLEKEDYIALIEEQDNALNNNVLTCYILDQTSQKTAIVNSLALQLNLTPIELMPKEKLSATTKNLENCIYPSVSKWITGFRDAEFVVTDSFHGMVFSIIFNKPFLAIGNQGRGLTRFTSLLNIFELEDRLIEPSTIVTRKMMTPIDYQKVNQIKKEWQSKSLNFLINALK